MDYQNGKIYTIRSHLTHEIYIGSTTQPLTKRLSTHKAKYKQWKKGEQHYTTSFKIIDFGDAYIELLEECPCNSKMLLHKREGELIRETECVNRYIPGRTINEYREDNKDKIKEQMKQYYKNNKDKISKKSKEYNKQYDQQKKEMRTCVCGVKYNYGKRDHRNRHYSTKKHTTFVENFYENFRELTCQ